MPSHGVPLHSVTKGSILTIIDIPEGRSREQLIRLGILKGELIKCLERLPGGTVVIEKNRQEIAIGASLAKTILVAYASEDGSHPE
jgi:Fe2+ transport system protein FeoA